MNTDARDTPSVLSAAAVALVCFAVGGAFVFSLRHEDNSAVADVSETPRPTAVATEPRSTTSGKPPGTSPTETAAKTDEAPAAPTAHEVAPAPSEPAPPTAVIVTAEEVGDSDTTAELQLIPGRVAYLRCDGLRADNGPFPCPRDVALEAEAWAVLGALPRCQPRLERGGVDVRLDLVRGRPTEVRVLPIAGSPEPTLDAERVYACVGKSLAKLNTRLDPIYMVVSLRASLR